MRCQRRILNVHWYERVTNISIASQTNLPHIGALIAARRYTLFGHVVRLPADIPCNMALRLWRDTSMKRRIPTSWKRPRRFQDVGISKMSESSHRPRTSWISQIRSDTGVPVATSWKRASDRVLWKAGATALKSYAVQWVSELLHSNHQRFPFRQTLSQK